MNIENAEILLVEDEEEVRDRTATELARRGFGVEVADSAESAIETLESRDFEAVVTGIHMEGMDGLGLAEYISKNRAFPVIITADQATMEKAIGAIRAGAYDFLNKPVDMDVLCVALERAVRHFRLSTEVERLREAIPTPSALPQLIGESEVIERLRDLVRRVARADVSVLITGESGTGKELVARALHSESSTKGRFVPVSCAAVPEALLESELFGHVKGAFTGADSDKPGLFAQAHDGTLFLDEIGEMPTGMQAKLLRALQESRVRPVGGTEEQPFNTRVIAATNRDLEEDIEQGRFREDLYYRINVVHIPVPPLRKRGTDVLVLAQEFAETAASRMKRGVKGISEPVAERLMSYDWPGNVRELQNCIERAVALARFDEITLDDLPENVREHRPLTLGSDADPDGLPSLEEIERAHIARVLQACSGNKSRAARILGVDRRTLYRKLERYGLDE